MIDDESAGSYKKEQSLNVMKRGFQIKKIAARKKADPQAVQRGRLFRAALFARFSFGCVFRRALVRRAKRADSYITSARRSAI